MLPQAGARCQTPLRLTLSARCYQVSKIGSFGYMHKHNDAIELVLLLAMLMGASQDPTLLASHPGRHFNPTPCSAAEWPIVS